MFGDCRVQGLGTRPWAVYKGRPDTSYTSDTCQTGAPQESAVPPWPCYVGGLLRGLPYRPNVTTSGRGKCSVLTGKPGRARANMRLLLAARCVHNQLAQLQSALPPRTCMRGMLQPPMPGAPGGAGAGWRVASAAEQALAAPGAVYRSSNLVLPRPSPASERSPVRANALQYSRPNGHSAEVGRGTEPSGSRHSPDPVAPLLTAPGSAPADMGCK